MDRCVKTRYNAIRTLDHTWVKHQAPRALTAALPSSMHDHLQQFQSQNDLKKVALHHIARQANEQDIQHLKDIFVSMDADQNGVLSLAELKQGFEMSGIKAAEGLKGLMDSIDANGSGQIDYTEFLAATMDKRQYQKENICWSAFRAFDRDGDGAISRQELSDVLASGELKEFMGSQALERIMKDCDKNGDDRVDWEEFVTMMRGEEET